MSNKLNRRSFMKLSAAAAGAFAVGNGFATPQAAFAGRTRALASHVTIGNTSLQANLNPYYFTYFQARQVYDTLIEMTADGQLTPGLATAWNRVDPLTLEVTLRDDVFFSNGDRMNARSVQYSMEHLLTIGVQNLGTYGMPVSDFQLFPPQMALFNMESFEVIDDTHLVIRTTRPDAILEKRLSRLFIFNERYMTESDNDLNSGAVGTGYFKVAEFVPGERIEFVTWDGNWRGSYPLQSATYVRLGDVRAALEAGDIDIAQSIAPDIAREMMDSGQFNVSSKTGLGTKVVSMMPETHEAFADVRVRRALNHAIDKQAFNDIIRAGFGRPTSGQLLQPGLDGYNDNLEGFEYNPELAMQLLREAGYQNLELTFGAANTMRADAEIIAGFLEAVGVRVNLETPDSGTIVQEMLNGTERNMIMFDAYYTTLADWSQAMISLFNPAPNAQRFFDNDDFYSLNMQIMMAPDVATRNDLIAQCSALMNEEAAMIYLSWVDFYFVHSKSIASVPFNLDNSPQIFAIEKEA